jgi:hypothetical protein
MGDVVGSESRGLRPGLLDPPNPTESQTLEPQFELLAAGRAEGLSDEKINLNIYCRSDMLSGTGQP